MLLWLILVNVISLIGRLTRGLLGTGINPRPSSFASRALRRMLSLEEEINKYVSDCAGGGEASAWLETPSFLGLASRSVVGGSLHHQQSCK